MKKLFFLLSIFAIVLSCSSDETSTPVTPPPAPIVKYTITLSAGEGGSVSTTGGEYEAGQTVSVTATPQGEYVFTSWSDGNTNATRTITISSNSTLTANFEKRKYPLTLNIEGEGEVLEEIVNAGRTTDYESGIRVKLTAIPSQGWGLTKWSGEIESKELSVEIILNKESTVNIDFHKRYVHVDRSPKYSYPNNTTSIYWEDKYVPNKFPKDSVFLSYDIGYEFSEHSTKFGDTYNTFGQGVFYDFNNDNNLDYFAWMKYGGYRNENGDITPNDFTKPGKFILISDVMNPTREHFLIDTQDKYFEFITELNDINEDGQLEIVSAYTNGHRQGDGTYGQTTNADILKINNQNSLLSENYLEINRDAHDISTGDVDNDGDVDILFWEYVFGSNPGVTSQNSMQPILFLNNGSGIFTKSDKYDTFIGLENLEKEVGYFREGNYWYEALTVELFDLNNDGNLDILASTEYSELADRLKPKNRIYWGYGNGTFNFENPVNLVNTTFTDYNSDKSYLILGSSFIDFDNDNDFDIVLTGSVNYNRCGVFVQIFKNDNNVFTDVTKEMVDIYLDDGGDNCNETRYQNNGYVDYNNDPHIIDIDDDGDYDILPHIKGWNNGYWWNNGENGWEKTLKGYTDNFFYENVGGKFELRWFNDN